MDPERRTVLVAPAWPYANGPRHIGHVAGFAVPADVLARFERLRGSRVLMASGTDEHGTPITYEADKQGIPPREFVDRNSALIVEDRGQGMDDETLRHALLPFYSTKPGGTGLGLALAGEIIDAHGGNVRLARREGGGMVVTCWIPD